VQQTGSASRYWKVEDRGNWRLLSLYKAKVAPPAKLSGTRISQVSARGNLSDCRGGSNV
jgi:hypothetical protein